jgi:hypothetical protein
MVEAVGFAVSDDPYRQELFGQIFDIDIMMPIPILCVTKELS